MSDLFFSTNAFYALLFAAGVFVLIVGTQWTRPVRLSNVETLYGDGRSQPTGVLRGLQSRLDAARFNLSAAQFLQVASVLVVLVFIAAYFLIGSLVPAVLCAGLSVFAYWTYLEGEANKAIEDYEEQLPQLVSRLVVGARMGNSFRGAAEHAAQFGPLLCREDWAYVCRQLDAGADLEMVFRVVSGKRQSQLLNSILELLLVQHQRGTPLSDVMPIIQESLTQRTRTIRLARTKLAGPLRELYIICAAPFAAVAVMRWSDSNFASMYSAPLGQAIVTAVFLVDILVFFFLRRTFSSDLRKETNFHGDLKPQPRAILQDTRPEANGRLGVGASTGPLSVQAPTALSRLFAPRSTEPTSEGQR
jgi:Flp pilus assembly protein TadB